MAKFRKTLQREALELVFWQLIVTMALSLIILFISGLEKGISVFLGGSTYIIPQFLFAWRVFSYTKARQVGQFMLAFFFGEFIKLILSATLFIFIVKYLPINTAFLMIGFIIAIVSFWFVCGWHFAQRNQSGVSS